MNSPASFSLAVEELKDDLGISPVSEKAGRFDCKKAAIADILHKKEQCNMIFAAAPSQNEVLERLANDPGILWNRINAFHMDEYCGLDAGGFRRHTHGKNSEAR